MIIKIDDARKHGKCVAGIRQWCKVHNIDFDEAIKNGIDSEILKSTNDAMALQIIEDVKNGR